jgi:hypothetical protein
MEEFETNQKSLRLEKTGKKTTSRSAPSPKTAAYTSTKHTKLLKTHNQ